MLHLCYFYRAFRSPARTGLRVYAGGLGSTKNRLGASALPSWACFVRRVGWNCVLKALGSQNGRKIDWTWSKNRPEIDPKTWYFRCSVPRVLRERFFIVFRQIFASRAQAPNLDNQAPVRAWARFWENRDLRFRGKCGSKEVPKIIGNSQTSIEK